jgi:small GTP-binding protein
MANTFRVVVVGDARSGKTSLVKRLLSESNSLPFVFSTDYEPTRGSEETIVSVGSKKICFVDCAGDPRYEGLQDMYWMNANAAIIMIDVSDPNWYTGVYEWIRRLNRHTYVNGTALFVCNKTDRPYAVKRSIFKYRISRLTTKTVAIDNEITTIEHPNRKWCEISVKDDLFIKKVLDLLLPMLESTVD